MGKDIIYIQLYLLPMPTLSLIPEQMVLHIFTHSANIYWLPIIHQALKKIKKTQSFIACKCPDAQHNYHINKITA